MAPEQYGPASVQYDDWLGTAAFDNPHDGIDEIREYARVPEGWDIVGIELSGGAEVDHSWAWVLAVERQRVEAAGGIEKFAAANNGAVPVTRFRVLESDGIGVLKAMKRWSIHVHPQSFPLRGFSLLVERDTAEAGWDDAN